MTDEQQIRDLIATWHAATKAGDIDAVLSLMTDDAVFLVAGRGPMSKAEFESLSRIPPGTPRPKFDGSFEIREIVVSGELAYAWTELKVSVTPPGAAKAIERGGPTLTVFKRIGGRWLLARDANLLSVKSAD